jgi:hypothetical protein
MKAKKGCRLKGKLKTTNKSKRTVRKKLTADAMFTTIREDFKKILDQRAANSQISLADALMSGFAVFQLKHPSLLAFDNFCNEKPENLHTIFGVTDIPCDSQMRSILDRVELSSLRAPFCSIFRELQRGKEFEKMAFIDGHYLLSGDGTTFYSSGKVSSPSCLIKKSRSGGTIYYQQMYAAAFVHPEHKEVVPLFPELITRKDGSTKNDCERNASHRFYKDFRREHPHLKVIVVEDGLSSNAPHIKDFKRLKLRFILGAKPGDHKFLFNHVDTAAEQGETTEICFPDHGKPEISHHFRYIEQVPLNESNQDLKVNFLEYWKVDENGKINKFSWVTDLSLSKDTVYNVMRAGRARWKIENETFNTLKNQGYNLGHNYGLGKNNLSAVLSILMMLAFMIDQVQQMSCWLYKEAREKKRAKYLLWESIRGFFDHYRVDSMETIYRAIVYGYECLELKNICQT